MLKGKTAIVTGSTSGIGLAIARALGASGVSNAGIQHTAPVESFSPERWDAVI